MLRFIKKLAARLRRTMPVAGAIALAVSGQASFAGVAADPTVFEQVRQADLRIATIGWRLALANVALCDRREPGTGIQLHTLDQFDSASREAARVHFGFATPVAIEAIVSDSPAARAGLRPDDSLIRIGSVEIAAVQGKPGTTDRLVAAQLAVAALPLSAPIEVDALRAGVPIHVTIQPIPVCKSRFELRIARDWSASADGTMVQIGSRFVEEYPEDQLAAVMAHEFAHNVLRHRDRLEARGVDYGLLAGFGGNVKYFRQTELQADLLSVYLLANANYRLGASVDFWKRFGPSKAGGILRSRSHPAWRDRIATISQEIARVETMSMRPLVPALIAARDTPLDGDWESLLIRHR